MDFKDLLGQWQHYATYDADMGIISHYHRNCINNTPSIWHFVTENELIMRDQNGTLSAVRYALNPVRLTLVTNSYFS